MKATDMATKSALGIFFRIPVVGKVKMRLADEIGENEACKAYKFMLHETIQRFSRLREIDLYGFYEGEIMSLNLRTSSGDPPILPLEKLSLYSQKGVKLGERMYNAIKWLFHKGYEKVSLVGADSPDLPLSYVSKAFEKLDAYDVVIGPSEDGGYYLIGMNKPHEVVFEGIQWGHETVLKDTICRAKAADISYFLLSEWYDIDNLDRLNRWRTKKSCFI
jgi:rSAM/selenodomain-associated transferase 1